MMGNAVVDNEYFCWLVNLVDGDEDDIDLLEKLHGTDFKWVVPLDENRAEDGKALRHKFMDEEFWNTEPMPGQECSMLEMLVALAMRIDSDIMWDPDIGDQSSRWFWVLIDIFGQSNGYDKVAIYDICARKSGICASFQKKSGTKKWKKMDIWYQIQAYFMQNWAIL